MRTGDGDLSFKRSKPAAVSTTAATAVVTAVGPAGAALVLAVDGTRGAVVGVRQHTAHTRSPGSFTNVQCSHCQLVSGTGGAGPRSSSSACSAVTGGVGVGGGRDVAGALGVETVRPTSRLGARPGTDAGAAARSLSLSLSESASLDGNGGGEGVRCLVRREVRDRTLIAGDAAREPVRGPVRDTPRLSPENE